MIQVFTDFVRSLKPSGEPPEAEAFEEVCRTLTRVLKSEIRKRGLWDSPPSYLGVVGWESWSDEAVDELFAECYTYVFIRRLDSLTAQLEVKDNIDGLVFLSVRNFLHDTQKQHDPLGFRVFEMLCSAVRAALEAEELYRLGGERARPHLKIRNDTVLAFSPDADAGSATTEELDAIVRGWNDALLPDLVTARGKARERTVTGLRSFLGRLPADGIEVFRFGQLVDPLKNDVRARWGSLLESAGDTAVDSGDGELRAVVDQILPDAQLEARDSFEKLVICMAEALEHLPEPARTRGYLSVLWEFLRTWSSGAASGDSQGSGGAVAAELAGDKLPSARKLARELHIPRDRVSELFSTLGGLVESCRAANSVKRPVNPGGRRHTSRATDR